MTSTLMKDSIVGDQWITEVCRNNPTAMLADENGNPTTMIFTGPVRLAFTDTLVTPKAPTGQPNGTPKYSVCALYTPFNDMALFYSEYYRVCKEMFQSYYVPAMNNGAGGYGGLESPFHDGANKFKFEGFTPGLTYINHTSKFKPSIVLPPRGPGMQPEPLVDMSKLYPGVWALLVVNAYGYGVKPPQPKKGVSFGLQSVMIIGDDKNLAGGGGMDAGQAFARANVKPPSVAPGSFAGVMPPPGAPPVYAPGAAPPLPMRGAVPMMPPGVPAADDISDLI